MNTKNFEIRNLRRWFVGAVKYFLTASAINAFLFFACHPAVGQNQVEGDLFKTNSNYRIGVGDVLRVTVIKQELLSVDGVRVSNEGTIRLPMLDAEISAACLTEEELTASISSRYKKYLLNPQIYVAVKEFNANSVALVGAVVAPGRFQLQRPMKLLELLALVNGPAPNAGKDIQIVRNPAADRCRTKKNENSEPPVEPTGEVAQEIISLPLADVMKGNETANLYIQAGDVIRVTEAQIQQAFVIGNVKTAVTINLREPVTLSKAIAMAGGLAQGAKSEKIKISRQEASSLSKTEIIVNLKEINNRTKDDILLQPNDIIDVPGPSASRKFLYDVFRTIVPAVTGVPIYLP
jgi:polysaccharide biosynthesis/export protein